jgi:hypothetical protein
MLFKERDSTRDMLLGSLILKQYKSIRRYSVRQSYVKVVRKHKIILLIQRRALSKQTCTEVYTKK